MLTSDWLDTDLPAYLDFCETVGIDDPTVPVTVWANESDNHPGAHNPNGDASGLFQLMPDTARGLGYPLEADPHLSAYRLLGVSGQLEWATKYYGNHKGQIGTVQRFYLCTFLPALLSCGDDSAHILAGAQGPLAWAYSANSGFDIHKRGYITVSDLADAAHRAVGPRTRELIGRILSAKLVREPSRA